MKYKGIAQVGTGTALKLGYPTVNIPLSDSISGIFAARITFDGTLRNAVAFADQNRKILEAHILDFNGNLYGKQISIELVSQIRKYAAFRSEEEAKNVITADVVSVRRYFEKNSM